MADEPASDDDARPAAARPAVHVDDAAGLELGVDLVEGRDEPLAASAPRSRGSASRRSAPAARRAPRTARARPSCVRSTKSVTPPSTSRRTSSAASSGETSARVPAGDQPAGLDHRRRAHAAQSADLPRPGGTSQRPGARADSEGMASPDDRCGAPRPRTRARERARRRPRSLVHPRARGGPQGRARARPRRARARVLGAPAA